MRDKVALVAAMAIGTAAMTTGATIGAVTSAMAMDQGGDLAKRSGYWTRAAWRVDRHASRVNGRGLPFGPPLGALYSYGSGRACDPYDPFTDIYGYCGGPYHYRW
jgi:hypothetical protein